MPQSRSPSTTPLVSQERYKYTPTEQGIFSPSPYKDRLLPLWRFRTPDLARVSTEQIWSVFLEYEQEDDFVGMDNARKFLQMGMTRAKRYANHKGGRKYAAGETAQVEAEESAGLRGGTRKKRRKLDPSLDSMDWDGREEKLEASLVFRKAWEKAKTWEGYTRKKAAFLEKQAVPNRRQRLGEGNAKDAKKRRKRNSEPEDATND